MTEALNEKHRGLKAVVIILGILIFVMVGVIVVTILNRAAQMGDEPRLTAFGEVHIPIPEGVGIGGSYVEDDRLMVDATDNESGERLIIVIDLETGEHLGTLRFTASGNGADNGAASSP